MSLLKPGLYRVVVTKAGTMEVKEGEYVTEKDLVAEIARTGEIEVGTADSLTDESVFSDATGIR